MSDRGNTYGILGYLLKMERIRQNKGQKEVCYGICTPSYLSKIEHGTADPDIEILKKLYERLGIVIESDKNEIENLQEKIEAYFKNLEYNIENHIYEELLRKKAVLAYSVCAIDWLIIQAMEKEDTYEELTQCKEFMNRRQLGYYAIISSLHWHSFIPKNREEDLWKKKMILEESKNAYDILQNSYAYNWLVEANYMAGDYAKVHQMESTLIALAVREGNTYALADYYMLDGSAYACLNMEEMMMQCYERAMKLLQNTNWKNELQGVYYNIGATLISSEKYEEAMEYLNKIEEPDFSVQHKKAMIMIRTGRIEEGKNFLKMAEEIALNNPLSKSDELKIKEAYFECESGFLEKETYVETLEELVKVLEKEKHFGHVYFYKDVILAAYKSQRKYKKMVSFLEKIQELKR